MNKNGTVSINKVFCENLFFFQSSDCNKTLSCLGKEGSQSTKKYQVLVDVDIAVVAVLDVVDVVNAVDVVAEVNFVVNMVCFDF